MAIQFKMVNIDVTSNAHYAAFPDEDWIDFTKTFVGHLNRGRKIKLEPNYLTTQVEPHDTYAELFDIMKRTNVILYNFDKNMWRYISDDWFKQKPVEGEVGSSTMPHKINPIDFENSEGNLAFANAIFKFLADELPDERLQRHLEDSTLERNFGVPLGHSLVGYKSLLKGLEKVAVNESKVTEALNSHPEVISEAIQTILRREGYKMPYEQLKKLTRGKEVTMDILGTFIDGLEVGDDVKAELKKITPQNYTGIAATLVEMKFK